MANTRQEVIDKVSAYVTRVYGDVTETSFQKAFNANDSNVDGRLSLNEIADVLAKAGVGFRLTRWAVAKEIVDLLDSDGDGYVEWKEFLTVFNTKK